MTAFSTFESTIVLLPLDDIDTDQIIPARFLKGTGKRGLGAHLFADRRAPDFPLIAPEARGAQILLAGANFGCGSSREHAAWALTDWGFRAIVARSFADIFRENALKNGILPVALDAAAHAALVAARSARADLVLQVDLVAQRVTVAGDPDASFGFAIDPFARSCLVHGVDELGYLLGFEPRITAYEQRH
ncbi:MAG: 3-isopropylmalate dehydratase small subunit [Deltaproteobacteria bacterium]|nr:MAG: 3-isopropylmalate dehydratase small subunit [Deltaproteobacteria bacterium]TMQ13356.1 MAG: 3-isopropylmalate dehydratase small subunit [Deltaproteobacteria bacterium]